MIIKAFDLLTSYIGIADVSASHIRQAMASDFTDFEDSVVYYSAIQINDLITIVTRNKANFSSATTPVLTPDEWLATHINH